MSNPFSDEPMDTIDMQNLLEQTERLDAKTRIDRRLRMILGIVVLAVITGLIVYLVTPK